MSGLVASLASPAAAQQFQEQQNIRFPQPANQEYTNQAAIADVNNSGSLDIAWANGQGFVAQGTALRARLYMNDGSGFFTDESTARLGALGGWFRSVNFGDINSNGRVDMALANDYNNLPALMVNHETEVSPGVFEAGYYTNETATRLPNITMSSARVQFFDSNNNGHLDLLFVNGGPTNRFGCAPTRLFLNDGDGFYTNASTNVPQVNICGPMDAKIGDVNNNFDLDIRVGALNNNQSRLFINNGDGTFANQSATVPADGSCYSYDMADINGNGYLDMFGINAVQGSSINLLLGNNGNGTWTNITSQISSNFNVDDNDSKFLDYNNNGHFDLLVARIFGPERLYENNGSGSFTLTAGVVQGVTASSLDVMVADLTGDGRLDFITANGESGNFTNRIFINVSGPPDTIPPSIDRTEQVPDTDDLDGPYVVRASISDSHTGDMNFYHKGIHLNYSVDGGSVQQVPMKFSGGMIYRGEIPGIPTGGIVEYFVTAIDHNDNLGTGPTLSFTIDSPVPPCAPADLNCDGVVNVFDLLELLSDWGPCADCGDCPADLDADCTVNVFDLLILLSNWG